MRALTVLLVAACLILAGCVPQPLVLSLLSPASGSSLPSLTPVLAWNSSGGATSFRLQVAFDGNFQQMTIDASNLGEPVYTVPSGRLNNNTTYYWRVTGSRENTTSGWSASWSFATPGGPPPSKEGKIRVSATLDGGPWSGPVTYSIRGPFSDTDNSLPWVFDGVPEGGYTVTYNYGGPPGATLVDITPLPSQTLEPGDAVHFVLNFQRQSSSTIRVNATLDGVPWSGGVAYSIVGPVNASRSAVPGVLGNAPAGTYTLSYSGGGPARATLGSITPAPSLTLGTGTSGTFSLDFFTSQTTGNIVVNATLNGSPWTGELNFTLSGPLQQPSRGVPVTYDRVPAGTYTLSYAGGGPAGAALESITPAPSQALGSGRTIVFNLNFLQRQQYGTVVVNAEFDGQPWRTTEVGGGPISYTLVGTSSRPGDRIPGDFRDIPSGHYTLSYNSGGPKGATLTSVSPSPSQNLPAGGTITYTLDFTGQPKGRITVLATLDGQPWSGALGYSVVGPYVESGQEAPRTFSNAPTGTYALQYNAGGPPGGVFEEVSPARQVMPAGGDITFTIRFKFHGVKPGPLPGPLVR